MRSQKTCTCVPHVWSRSLADGTQVTREWTEMKGDGVFTGEGHKTPPCTFLERCCSSKWIWEFFWEEKGVVCKGEKVSLPLRLTHRVILDCCLPTLGRVHTGNQKGRDSFKLRNVSTWSFRLNSSERTPPWKKKLAAASPGFPCQGAE